MLSIVTHAEGRRPSLDRLLSVIARMRPRPFEVVVVDRGGPPVRARTDLVGEMRTALSRRQGLVMADVRDVPAAQGDGRAEPSRPNASGRLPARLEPDRQDGPGDDLGHAAARAGVPIWLWPTALVHRQATTRETAPT